MGQRLEKRVRKLEGDVGRRDPALMVAARYPDGTCHWNGRDFESEAALSLALSEELGKTDELFIIISNNKPLVILDD